jgi:chemotaxis protein MotA
LVGTLIGLVQMLGSLNNPAAIGPAMAIALLTTLYGALFSYVILIPLTNKLERNAQVESTIREMYQEAVLAIGRQEHPRKLELIINSLLPPAKRVNYFG